MTRQRDTGDTRSPDRRPGTDGTPAAQTPTEGESVVVPLARESVDLRRRRRTRALVRVHIGARQREVLVDVPVTRSEIDIERVPIGKPVDQVPEPRTEGDVTIIPVVEEKVVVTTQMVLKEEIRVHRRVLQGIERRAVVLREEEARIERIASPDPAAGDLSREGAAAETRTSGTEPTER